MGRGGEEQHRFPATLTRPRRLGSNFTEMRQRNATAGPSFFLASNNFLCCSLLASYTDHSLGFKLDGLLLSDPRFQSQRLFDPLQTYHQCHWLDGKSQAEETREGVVILCARGDIDTVGDEERTELGLCNLACLHAVIGGLDEVAQVYEEEMTSIAGHVGDLMVAQKGLHVIVRLCQPVPVRCEIPVKVLFVVEERRPELAGRRSSLGKERSGCEGVYEAVIMLCDKEAKTEACR